MTAVLEHEAPIESALAIPLDPSLEAHEPPEVWGRGRDSVRLLVGSELQFDPCPMVREGMMVQVTHGPLRGVVGRLMRKDAPRARLVLSVDLIGQAVSVEVDASDVKPY